ncbi:SDR family oxidoreductase [Alkalihalophilus pseudofirmus]|uniref:SDR family oxidoreductase n=1 Tax=Alkalihalophilus pseudofirmus TaxID=79885 RepID=A0AAJ2NRB2_ALKPS|nr:SDR family oxidoreductase [Alkalihalophilus pseudofirmus]MDV2886973.1 SDR family oxidoreductase [Alkalihalophilus pseudofirmus]
MKKQVVAITGASSGLGAALAKLYGLKGAHVCLLGRSKEKLESSFNGQEGSYSAHALNIVNKEEVASVFHQLSEEFGEVDMLINNAGAGYFGPAEDLGKEELDTMLDVNVKGTIYPTQAVLPQMKKRNKGVIVNIVSTAGLVGKANESGYVASKFAVRGFTESLQAELSDTMIRISGIYMGGMDTPFWDGIFSDEKRKMLMQPKDVAEIIVHNLDERTNLSVDEVIIRNKKPKK